MSSLPSLATPPRRFPLKQAVATACVAATAAGASVVLVSSAERDAAPATSAPVIQGEGARLATSFGSVSVDYVFRLVGSNQPMGLKPPAGTVPIQVGVTVINTKDEPVRLPSRLFGTAPAAAASLIDTGSLVDRTVPPLSAHRILLRLAVRDGVALPSLLVRDSAQNAPMRVELGGTADQLKTMNVGTHKFEGAAH